MRKIIIPLALILFSSCKDEKNQSKVKHEYFKNGQIKHQYKTDSLGELHGNLKSFDINGKQTVDAYFFHGKEMTTKIYRNNNSIEMISYLVKGNEINSHVILNKNGEIDGTNSSYAIVEYLSKNKLKVSLPNFYKDSITVYFKSDFSDIDNLDNHLARVNFIQPIKPEIIIDLKEEYYSDNRLNIQILTYDKLPSQKQPKGIDFKVYFPPGSKEILIQLDRNEIPKRYNIDPIW